MFPNVFGFDELLLITDVTALPGRQGFRDSMKRSRLGCYTGSSVWGRVKGFQGSRWQRSECQGVQGVQGRFQGSRRDFGRLLTKSSLGLNWSMSRSLYTNGSICLVS